MKFLLITFLFTVEAKLNIFIADYPVEQIGTRYYQKELLTDQFQDPKELTYDSTTRSLFFMYMDEELQNSGRAYVNVVTKKTKKIAGISKNKAVGVDIETSEVYFGSEDGLYKFDPLYNNATQIGLYNVNIMKIVIRENAMFVLDANDHMIYRINDSKAREVGPWKTVMEFEVDYKRNIHFVTMCGLFCAPRGNEAIKNNDLPLVYHFLSDEEKAFGITLDGIYELHCENGTAKRVADIDFYIRSIAFGDYGDIYYSTDDNIFRLKPVNSYVVYNFKKSRT